MNLKPYPVPKAMTEIFPEAVHFDVTTGTGIQFLQADTRLYRFHCQVMGIFNDPVDFPLAGIGSPHRNGYCFIGMIPLADCSEIYGDQFPCTDLPVSGLPMGKCPPGAGSYDDVKRFVVSSCPFHGKLEGEGHVSFPGSGPAIFKDTKKSRRGKFRSGAKQGKLIIILDHPEIVKLAADGNKFNIRHRFGQTPVERHGGMFRFNSRPADIQFTKQTGEPLQLSPILSDLQSGGFQGSLIRIAGIGQEPALTLRQHKSPVAPGKTGKVSDIGKP